MTFTEKSHAFIAAQYYRLMHDRFGDQGTSAFIHATMYYGEQRGRRMAQRCIKDGKELTAANYYRYGEWNPTKEMIETQQSNQSTFLSYEPDRVSKITRCPWAKQFHEMGLNETGGEVYCKAIDAALVRGFNPELSFTTEQTLQTNEFCIQRMRNAGISPDEDLSKDPGNIKGFGYHCAHMFYAYRDICEAVFGEEGTAVSDEVFRLYEENYGTKDAAYIRLYAGTDFSRCDSKEY